MSRIAGRLLTGPFAFLIAGVVDLVVFSTRMLVQRGKAARNRRN